MTKNKTRGQNRRKRDEVGASLQLESTKAASKNEPGFVVSFYYVTSLHSGDDAGVVQVIPSKNHTDAFHIAVEREIGLGIEVEDAFFAIVGRCNGPQCDCGEENTMIVARCTRKTLESGHCVDCRAIINNYVASNQELFWMQKYWTRSHAGDEGEPVIGAEERREPFDAPMRQSGQGRKTYRVSSFSARDHKSDGIRKFRAASHGDALNLAIEGDRAAGTDIDGATFIALGPCTERECVGCGETHALIVTA